jgi:ABC-2 type transport system ATP-binding protein
MNQQPSTAPMIEARDLRRVFDTQVAVAGISFSVPRGEIFGLLGPNGAGKTTTLRMLTGQIDPSGGRARVAGCDVVRERPQLKAHIGVVFEEQNPYERLSARLNLQVACWLYGIDERRVDAVLDLVGLRDRARDPVRTFSSGLKQRLMIARALLPRPQVLFLDEPARGLDPLAAREVHATIEQLRQGGTTILLTTHLMDEADQLCQRVAFLVAGHLVANDTPRQLKLAHGQRALVVTVATGAPSPEGGSALQDCTLSLDDPADQATLAAWMGAERVRAIHSREATLEEVFMAVAGAPLT